jgi:hypothetical protein
LDRRHGYQLANLKELREWQVQVSKIPLDAIFAAEPDYNHPLILLGRRVVCGYEGHLSSHGLDYKDRMNHLRLALTLRPGWQTHAKSTGADFLVLRENDNRGLLILPVD